MVPIVAARVRHQEKRKQKSPEKFNRLPIPRGNRKEITLCVVILHLEKKRKPENRKRLSWRLNGLLRGTARKVRQFKSGKLGLVQFSGSGDFRWKTDGKLLLWVDCFAGLGEDYGIFPRKRSVRRKVFFCFCLTCSIWAEVTLLINKFIQEVELKQWVAIKRLIAIENCRYCHNGIAETCWMTLVAGETALLNWIDILGHE